MDLIEKIKGILNGLDFKSPIIEMNYDNQQNITGYVADETFASMSDSQSQKLIWDTLTKQLGSEDLHRIIAIFHETPIEHVKRITGFSNKGIKSSKFWVHETPELAKYYLFIDVAKFEEEFKSFYLIINERRKINKHLTFNYTKEVLDFMELTQSEIHEEIFTNTFNNAEAEIKMDLMKLSDDLSKKQLWGSSNMYWYVYGDFNLTPLSKNQIFLTAGEIEFLKKSIVQLDDFSIKNDLERIIKFSDRLNKSKKEMNEFPDEV